MPNNGPDWCVDVGHGNPTKSSVLNDLFRFVRSQKVKGLGSESQKVREFELSEFGEILKIYRGMDSSHN